MSGLQLTNAQRLPALLMAVTALWALIFAVAGLTGLAGRYRLHPDDPGRIPPMPTLDLSRAQSLLQSIDAYADIAERPLFNPDRRPVPIEEAEPGEGVDEPIAEASPLDIVLTSVIITDTVKLAIVTDNRNGQSQSLKLGDTLAGDQAGWRLETLESRKAVFAGYGGTTPVDLRVFDGTGGQAPSAPGTAAVVNQVDAGADADAQHAPAAETSASPGTATPAPGQNSEDAAKPDAMTAEERATMIRRRIEERRRQMREEAERANRR